MGDLRLKQKRTEVATEQFHVNSYEHRTCCCMDCPVRVTKNFLVLKKKPFQAKFQGCQNSAQNDCQHRWYHRCGLRNLVLHTTTQHGFNAVCIQLICQGMHGCKHPRQIRPERHFYVKRQSLYSPLLQEVLCCETPDQITLYHFQSKVVASNPERKYKTVVHWKLES